MQINSKLISSGVLFYLSYLIYLKWRNFLHDIEIVDRHIAIDYKEFIAAYMGFVPWNQYKKRVRNIDLSTILILCAVVILFAVNKTNATFYNASFWLIFIGSGGVLSFMSLRNIKKYSDSLIKLLTRAAEGSSSILGSMSPFPTRAIIAETCVVLIISISINLTLLKLDARTLTECALAIIILYASARSMRWLRQYFTSVIRLAESNVHTDTLQKL